MKKEKQEMIRSTIYLSRELKTELLAEAHTYSLQSGRRYSMADIIHDALLEYFEKRGKKLKHAQHKGKKIE